MRDRTRDALRALFGASAGGFLAAPPGLDGSTGLGLVGITGAPRPRNPWDAIVSVVAPSLPGETLVFHALPDGTLVVDEDVPAGSVAPLADAVERSVQPPYRAEAVRHDADVWAVAARRVEMLDLPGVQGDELVASRVGDQVDLSVDCVGVHPPEILRAALAAHPGDVAIVAERIDGALWSADVSPL